MTEDCLSARVLFICRGNLCRSPMAIAVFQQLLGACQGRTAASDSAGYFEWGPFPREAHPFARRAVAQLVGCDTLSEHRAKRWSPAMVEWATCIVVAEEWMKADFPREKVVTLRDLAGEQGDVADPYGCGFQDYIDCCSEIRRLISSGMDMLLGLPRPEG